MAIGKNLLGINGLGRIGKLTLWYHLREHYFDGFVVNVGREVGTGLQDIIHTIERDSTYGQLTRFLYGHCGQTCEIEIVDDAAGLLNINGLPVKVLRTDRNPKDIKWAEEGVRLVVDCTGKFLDPTIPADQKQGSARGHLEAGAHHVIVSAPFKIKDPTIKTVPDAGIFVYGINHIAFDPNQHKVISAASCTTTGLAHMMKPLMEEEETADILTASMSTVHSSTSTQSILDTVPKTGATDLRKGRSVLNNIILTSTGAARALGNVMPEINQIGFMADSLRIPTNTVSLIVLNLTFHTPISDSGKPVVNHEFLNDLYRKAAEGEQKGLLSYSERQNVSSDFIGHEAAIIIEGHQTHTRTGFMELRSDMLKKYGIDNAQDIQVPVTHAKIFGWYDNEFGSYVRCLGKLTEYVYQNMR